MPARPARATCSTPTAGSDSGASFDVVVSNSVGTVTSAAATLTVNVPPSITTPPANVTVTAPDAANFSVVAAGDAPLSYQWRRNGAPIAGATSASYVLTPTAGSDSGASFDVVVSNGVGSVTSAAATLTVNVTPSITTPPANVTVTAPAAATFSVVAAGTAPLRYQWRRNGVAISGATSASYVLTPTAGTDSGASFDVVVSNGVGTVTSAAATLTVNVRAQHHDAAGQRDGDCTRRGQLLGRRRRRRAAQLSVAPQRRRHRRRHQRQLRAHADRRQ